MLYDFHTSQNAKKPGSLHATYLLYGVKKAEQSKPRIHENGDVEMSSSMAEVESIPERIPTLALSLVNEAKLSGKALCPRVSRSVLILICRSCFAI